MTISRYSHSDIVHTSLCNHLATSYKLIITPLVGTPRGVITISGAYEPPEGRKERPTPYYSVKRHLNLNDCDAFLIWTSTQVVQKCYFHNQRATLQVRVARLWLRALVMKTTLLDHLSLRPYKESVTSVQIQMPFHAVGRSFRPWGGSYAPATT